MEFTIVGGDYYPISFRNDYLGRNDSVFDDDGINLALQADLTAFANQWMQNIAIQQNEAIQTGQLENNLFLVGVVEEERGRNKMPK